MTSMKLRLAVVFRVHYLIRIPRRLSFLTMKLLGGTVHVLKLEKAELIDGDMQQECSVARQLKSSTPNMASRYSVLNENKFCLCIHTIIRLVMFVYTYN